MTAAETANMTEKKTVAHNDTNRSGSSHGAGIVMSSLALSVDRDDWAAAVGLSTGTATRATIKVWYG